LEEVGDALAKLLRPRTDPMLVIAPLAGPMRFGSEAEATAFHDKLLREARRRREWLQARRWPPKCIRCGTTDVVDLPEGRAVLHPAGNGTITLSWVGMCSTPFNEWFFTPEGDRIPRDTTPTYWHHPALGAG
jgi:hypothetical protein